MLRPLIALVQQALDLLNSGRIGKVRKVLETLMRRLGGIARRREPQAEPGVLQLQTGEQATSPPPVDMATQEFREHVSSLGARRVAEVLDLRLVDLGPLLAGEVEVAPDRLRRLRTDNGGDKAA